jgi:hypothetical protein
MRVSLDAEALRRGGMRLGVLLFVLFGGAVMGSGFQGSANIGTVTGRVVEAHSGDPAKVIRKALVVLRRGPEQATGTYTDDKGNYRLQVEPGAYTLSVERDGYVAPPKSKNRTLEIQAGQTASDVNLELLRSGVISGRILDSDGEPVPRANVQLLSASGKKGATYYGAMTDDRGAYRIFQIPPGKYHLFSTYQPGFQERDFKLQTPDGKPQESYIATYFPGTPNAAQAASIDVPVAADLAGFDFQLQRVHAVRVRGRISGL